MRRLAFGVGLGFGSLFLTACSLDRSGVSHAAHGEDGGGLAGDAEAHAGDGGSSGPDSSNAPRDGAPPDAPCIPTAERCDDVDTDCDGNIDEDAVDALTFYADADGDGHGDPAITASGCTAPSGFVALADDCLDTDATVGPDGDLDGDTIPDCVDLDDDGDGITDLDEEAATFGFLTDPENADSDDDGVDDGADPAPRTAACSEALLYHDPFRSAPSPEWMPVSGAWQWDGTEVLASTDTTRGATTWLGPRSWTDYVVAVRLRPDSMSGDGGFGFRAQSVSATNDGGAHYYVGVYPNNNEVRLGYMDGSWHLLATGSANIDPGVFYTVEARVTGDRITIFVDGTQVIDTQHTLYATGSVSFRTYQHRMSYDSVVVCQ